MNSVHRLDRSCTCAEHRHARFNPGPPTSPKYVGFYGHHSIARARKVFRAGVWVRVAAREEQQRTYEGMQVSGRFE